MLCIQISATSLPSFPSLTSDLEQATRSETYRVWWWGRCPPPGSTLCLWHWGGCPATTGLSPVEMCTCQGFRVSIGCFSEALVEMNTGTRRCGYDYGFKQQKSLTMKMNSNQSAGIQHVRGCHTSKTGRELCSVKLMLMSCSDERMLTRVPNPMLNEALKQTKCCCEFTSSFTSNTAATAARQLL